MVSDGGNRDRGQLILIGAVAIAFILLGIVVVFNSVLYTQTIASSETVESGVDARTTELELERGGSRLAQAVNRNEETNDSDDLNETLLEDDGVVWEFASQYGRTKAAAKPTMIDVDNSSGTVNGWGRLVEQETEDDFASSSGGRWDVFGNESLDDGSLPERELGRLRLTINKSSLGGDTLNVELDDGNLSGVNVLTFSESGENVSATLNPLLGPTVSCELTPRGDGKIRVNLVEGTAWASAVGDECNEALNLTSGLDEEYERLTFDSGGGARGTYEVVVSATDENDETEIADPNYLAVWSYEFDYRYDTAEVSYTRTIEVDVYGGDS